jgi:type II secretory ATPase GspE/PulE/Tfp pilus assembly ATPase PilB-like protein
MPSDRIFAPSSAAVTVTLLDGQTHVGEMTRFAPRATDIALSVAGGGKVTLAAERVAYLGFHKSPGQAPPAPSARVGAFKVHAILGKTFVVDLVESGTPEVLGFYARPSDPQSRFKEMFFYAHGVTLREMNEPLGEMLVRDGRLAASDLQQGLEVQRSEPRTPIGEILLEQQKVERAALDQAAALQKRKGTRLGEVLIEAGLVTAEDVELALSEQRKRGGKRIGQILVDLKLVSESDLAQTLAKKFQLPFVDLDACDVDLDAVAEITREVIEKYRILPVASTSRVLMVALGDPLSVDGIDMIRLQVKKQIAEVVAIPSQLDAHIARCLAKVASESASAKMGAILKDLSDESGQDGSQVEGGEASPINESDSAIVKLANQIVFDAYRRGASDIHIEPNGKDRKTVVRFRIDGDCVAYQEIPAAYRMPLVARFKIMATLDIAERRKPQDGKIRIRVEDRQIELRVATIPTVNGNEDIVLRILAASEPIPLEKLGLSPRNFSALKSIITKPYGLVLCVGPTGSGKTTTLHSALGAINTVDMKIWTAEDPVEITQHGLRQVQMNPKIGLTFAVAMRAFLRADPDAIMVGEMRDQETAETGIEASLTGHLVFSTLHTNSAPETVTRLIDMGLDPFSFADSLLGVLAQRLARALCKQCREARPASRADLEELSKAYGAEAFRALLQARGADPMTYRSPGCEACGHTGYRGRVALHELLVADDALKAAVQRKAPIGELRSLAQAGGMTTLLQDGVEKVLLGQTDLKQVLAVCSR